MEMDIESVRDKWMSQKSALYPIARLEVITPGIENNLPAYEIHFFLHWRKSLYGRASK